MWISTSNGRKSKKDHSLDKIRQYFKLIEKPPLTNSLVKSSSISSGVHITQDPNSAKDKQNTFNTCEMKYVARQPKTSNSSVSILNSRISYIKNKIEGQQKEGKVGISSLLVREKEKVKMEQRNNQTCENGIELPYFIQCMAKKHKLLGEMHLHIHNSIFTFREFLKACEGMKIKCKPLPLVPEGQGKKTIVFDMDQTLIHTNETITPHFELRVPFRSYQGKIGYGYVNVRPYAKQILQRLSKHFQIIIFTASSPAYADPILDYIDPDKVIQYRLYRDHCTLVKNQIFVKDLRILNRKLQNVVLVDNAPYSYLMQLSNAIPILPYYRGKEDRQLLRLEEYLMTLKHTDDVREKNSDHFCLHEYLRHDSHQKVISSVYSKWVKQLK